MNANSATGRFWLAVAAYLLPTFPLGYGWHLVAFGEQYRALGLYRAEVIIPFGLASMVVQAVLFAWLYPRLFDTARSAWLTSAARFGAMFGVLASPSSSLPLSLR